MRSGRLRILLTLLTLGTATLSPLGVAAKSDPTTTVPQTRALYLQLIRQARLDGRARAAIAYLDDFDQRYPRDLEAQLLRINSLLDLGQIDPAQAIANQLGAGKGGDGQAALDTVRGHLFAAQGKWGDAVGSYQRAVDGSPTDAILRNDLGYALLRQGATDRAIETLRGASDLAPDDAIIRNNLILAFALGGQTDAMTRALARVGDGRARADLRRQVLAEVLRVSTVAPVPHGAKPANEEH